MLAEKISDTSIETYQEMLHQCSGNSETSSTLIVIPDNQQRIEPREAEELIAELSQDFKTFVVLSQQTNPTAVWDFVAELSASIKYHGIKRATVFGIGAGASTAQALFCHQTKLVRRLILLNPRTRLAPGPISKLIDFLESHLPLGLPLRSASKNFDSRPMLHRITCPVLILKTAGASLHLSQEAQTMADRIPNSWIQDLKAREITTQAFKNEIYPLVHDFLQVPVKRPQKSKSK